MSCYFVQVFLELYSDLMLSSDAGASTIKVCTTKQLTNLN